MMTTKLLRKLPWLLLAAALGLNLSASAAPIIVHQPVIETWEKQAMEVHATITDPVAPVLQVRLFYRATGSLAYNELLMDGGSFNFSATIPAIAINSNGLEYYLEARNQIGDIVTSPMMNAANAPYRVIVRQALPAPEITLLSPESGTEILAEEAVVVMALNAGRSQIDLESIRVYLDEKDVTTRAMKTPTMITYVPEDALPAGLHGLRVSLRNQDGVEAKSPTWTFRISTTKKDSAKSWQEENGDKVAVAPSWRGDIRAEAQYSVLQKNDSLTALALTQPEGWLNRFNANIYGTMGDWKMLGTFFVTSEERPGRQPVDRIRVDLINPAWTISLGDNYPVFTDYSANMVFIRGGYFRWLTGEEEQAHSEIAISGGLNQSAEMGSNADGTPALFERYILVGRWLTDFLPGVGFSLNGGGLMDNAKSVPEAQRGVAVPYNNALATGEGHLQIGDREMFAARLFGEYAYSYNDEELNFFTMSLGNAYRGGLRCEWLQNNYLAVEYKHTGTNYVDLANPWLAGDWAGVNTDARLQLFEGNVIVAANCDLWRDNLESQKDNEYFVEASNTTVTAGTTFNQLYAGNINIRLWPVFSSVSVGYSLNQCQDQAAPDHQVNNQTQVTTLGLAGQWPFGAQQILLNLTYLINQYQDLAPQALSGDVTTTSMLASLIYMLEKSWSFNAGVGRNQNVQDNSKYLASSANYFDGLQKQQTINYQLMNLKLNWRPLPSQLDLGLGWESMAGKDDADALNNQLTTISLSGTYYFASAHSLGATVSDIAYTDQISDRNSYRAVVVNLLYRLKF